MSKGSADPSSKVSQSRPSLRDWIREQANDLNVERERLLFASSSRDPMWKGTAADHEKAEWFAVQYQRAIAERTSDRVHVRGVHYTLVDEVEEPVAPPSSRCSWDEYQNTQKCYDYLVDCSVLARVLGYVPLGGIIDQKNDSTIVTEYGSHHTDVTPESIDYMLPSGVRKPAIPTVEESAEYLGRESLAEEFARKMRNELSFDTASQQPFHVEIWSEKTVPGGTEELAKKYGVNAIVEGQGDLSYQVAHDLVQRIEAAGKPAVILYLSDFDPKGDNMASAMASKLAWLEQVGEVSQRVLVKQMAVTKEQIAEFDLPRAPIDTDSTAGASAGKKAYNTLVSEWEEKKGSGAVELQALWRNEERFLNVVEGFLQPLWDPDISNQNWDRKQEWTRAVAKAARETLAESDVPDAEDAILEWVEEFNAELDEAAEHLEALNELLEDDRWQGWQNRVHDALLDVDVDEPDVPRGEGHLPAHPLYDSERGYVENVREVERHKNGTRDTGF